MRPLTFSKQIHKSILQLFILSSLSNGAVSLLLSSCNNCFYLLFQYVLKDSLYLYFFISSISYGVQPSFKGCGAMASVMLDILNLILIGLL